MQKIQLKPEDILDEAHLSPGIINYLTYSGIHDFQRYHGSLRRFAPLDSLTLNSGFIGWDAINSNMPPTDVAGKKWSGILKPRNSNAQPSTKTVFSKIIHLVDPFEFMQRSHTLSYIPSPDASDRDKLRKHAISRYNQASVDATVCYILSRLGNAGLSPATVEYYETICGIAENYLFRITDDFETYRNKRWFWSYAENDGSQIVIDGNNISEELKQWIITKPSDEELDRIDDEEYEEEVLMADSMYKESETPDASATLEEITFDMEDLSMDPPEVLHKRGVSTGSITHEEGSITESEIMMEELSDNNGEIYLKCKNIPVLVCFQEAANGTMDELLNELDENKQDPDGIFNDHEAERKWAAWLFQVCAALSVFQKYVNFCHNDLHTNNIVWVPTDQEFLYYKSQTGSLFKVPTYGKIFKLIDFGRATAEVGGLEIISTDYETGQDAWGMYNWGPIKDSELSTVAPNSSFDLCRLAISLFEILYPGYDPEEHNNDLAAMLWSWMIDEHGQSVLYDDDDNERFSGFDLYVHIGQHVSSAIPCEQFKAKPFSQFKWRGKAARAAVSSSSLKIWPIYTDDIGSELDD